MAKVLVYRIPEQEEEDFDVHGDGDVGFNAVVDVRAEAEIARSYADLHSAQIEDAALLQLLPTAVNEAVVNLKGLKHCHFRCHVLRFRAGGRRIGCDYHAWTNALIYIIDAP